MMKNRRKFVLWVGTHETKMTKILIPFDPLFYREKEVKIFPFPDLVFFLFSEKKKKTSFSKTIEEISFYGYLPMKRK